MMFPNETGSTPALSTTSTLSGNCSGSARPLTTLFENYDLVVLPTTAVTMPETIQWKALREGGQWCGNDREPLETSNCTPFNTFGIPAVSIPSGFSATGLTGGLMLA